MSLLSFSRSQELTSQSSCLFHDLVLQWCLLFPAVNLAVSRMAKLFTHTLSDFWAENVLATCRGSCSWSPLRACADSRLPFTLPQCWMTTGSSLGPGLTTVHHHRGDHSIDSMDLCWQSNVFGFQHTVNTLFRFVIAFLQRSKHLLIS